MTDEYDREAVIRHTQELSDRLAALAEVARLWRQAEVADKAARASENLRPLAPGQRN